MSVLAIILAFVLFLPEITLAAPATVDTSSPVIVKQASNSISETNLTPQVRQQLQAVRQRRNRDIGKVLDSSQLAQLTRNLRSGDNLNQAIEKLNLQGDQQEMVKAIARLAELKMKKILSQHPLQAK